MVLDAVDRVGLVDDRMGRGKGTSLAPPPEVVVECVQRALDEDLKPDGDLTAAILSEDVVVVAAMGVRSTGVLAGSDCANEAFRQVDSAVRVDWRRNEGDVVKAGEAIATVVGPLGSVLTAERTALNFLGHLSGIATLVAQWVEVAGTDAVVWDTRKTTPGLRVLEKAAVRAGGGANHRANLSEWVMIKDNHLFDTDIATMVQVARSRWPDRIVHVECDEICQLRQALEVGVDAVLLDNMAPAEVKACVDLVAEWEGERPLLEASGGITLDVLADYAATGVDCISSGVLTSSAPALDVGLDISPDLEGLFE
ncbi:MAG: carboxylating nicotinate-nucleotide diphosphorylase [Acidimicrobiales bacterium]|jgi:nicotinate-nucleotide pyrophosphorylase (carboxylating)|nr:carboxylating nicotinate-nucleotide diphosphorylase [Acidimicrobiales bacterium]